MTTKLCLPSKFPLASPVEFNNRQDNGQVIAVIPFKYLSTVPSLAMIKASLSSCFIQSARFPSRSRWCSTDGPTRGGALVQYKSGSSLPSLAPNPALNLGQYKNH